MVEANVKAVKMVEVVEVVEAELELLVELADMIKSCIEAEVEIVQARVDVRGLLDNTPLPVAVMFTFETKLRFYENLQKQMLSHSHISL